MPTIDAEGIKTFEAEQGKKLVLALEDNGIDILHRCGGNARWRPGPGAMTITGSTN